MDLRPRLHLPFWLQWLLIPLRSRLVEPFQLEELAKLPPGRLVDVGCGNGDLLAFARQLGWHAIGLELDPAAVRAARTAGLDVIEGSYVRLAELKGELDCIICSHVLEHVHDPRDMLVTLAEALRPGGVLLLSLPNAASVVRQYFGDDWRGLEAPRHLTIPSMHQLEAALHQLGFTVKQRPLTRLWTAAESCRIRRRGMLVTAQDRAAARQLAAESVTVPVEAYDFVEFVCVKDPHRAD
jgi:2-polyprenyl-3-methyl-5-hydroxy-6-metoxy-1,4-benzoquinol methylase